MNDALIKTIVNALENKIAHLACADEYVDVLNALTEIIINTLKENESISTPQAYRRAVDVFADAAMAAEAEEKQAKEAAAEAKAKPPAIRRISTQQKYKHYQARQQRVAQRAARKAVRS
jgi:hypothetical protein